MTPEQRRQQKCQRILNEFNRAYRLAADDDQHKHREMGFFLWTQRNPYTSQSVAGWLADVMDNIRMRRA